MFILVWGKSITWEKFTEQLSLQKNFKKKKKKFLSHPLLQTDRKEFTVDNIHAKKNILITEKETKKFLIIAMVEMLVKESTLHTIHGSRSSKFVPNILAQNYWSPGQNLSEQEITDIYFLTKRYLTVNTDK